MTIKVSTGLAKYMLVTGCAQDALALGAIKVYSGAAPATADTATSGTLLWTVTVDGGATGISWAASDAVVTTADAVAMEKPSAVVWAGATTAGTAGYFRVVGAGDTGALSTTQPRVQGTCGMVAGSDMFMANTTLSTDASVTAKSIAAFSLTLPFAL